LCHDRFLAASIFILILLRILILFRRIKITRKIRIKILQDAGRASTLDAILIQVIILK